MLTIEFDNRTDHTISSSLYDQIEDYIKKTLVAEKVNDAVNLDVSFSFVTPDEIQELNRTYREKDAPTDVLSFPMLTFPEDDDKLRCDTPIPVLLGDIIISFDQAIKQAEAYGNTLEREICYLSVHSVLHLLGYDHMIDADKVIMRSREKVIMEDE